MPNITRRKTYQEDHPLYHWSPTPNRERIRRVGLTPGRLSTDKLWRAPYICFSDSPSMAWALSAQIRKDIPSWDLWMTWTDRLQGWERLGGRNEDYDEFRVYLRVFKSDLWFVGTRRQEDKP